MFRSRIVPLCGVLAVVSAAGLPSARAQEPPATRIVTYNHLQTLETPSSETTWAVDVELLKSQSSGNEIGWTVVSLTVVELDAAGVVLRAWLDETVMLSTPDGLWWTQHADPLSPDLSDFSLPPLMVGTAAAQDPGYADLDYSVEGVPYQLQPQDPVYDDWAALDYAFTLVGSSQSEATGDDLVAEVNPPDRPS